MQHMAPRPPPARPAFRRPSEACVIGAPPCPCANTPRPWTVSSAPQHTPLPGPWKRGARGPQSRHSLGGWAPVPEKKRGGCFAYSAAWPCMCATHREHSGLHDRLADDVGRVGGRCQCLAHGFCQQGQHHPLPNTRHAHRHCRPMYDAMTGDVQTKPPSCVWICASWQRTWSPQHRGPSSRLHSKPPPQPVHHT